MADKDTLAAREKAAEQDPKNNPTPGGSPPTDSEGKLIVDPAAVKVTDKLEAEAIARSGTPVPNAPGVGIGAAASPAVSRAGESRPSVDFPTHAAPEQAGGVVGVPAGDRKPGQTKAHLDLLTLEQEIQWLLQHQPPSVLPISGTTALASALARVQAERAKDEPDVSVIESIERSLLPHDLTGFRKEREEGHKAREAAIKREEREAAAAR